MGSVCEYNHERIPKMPQILLALLARPLGPLPSFITFLKSYEKWLANPGTRPIGPFVEWRHTLIKARAAGQ